MADNTSSNNPSTSSGQKSTGASSMAELMARQTKTFQTFRKGDQVKGTITKLTRGEILVDINAKTEAAVLEKDRALMHALLSMLKVGDEVTVGVLNPESDNGNPVVSLRRFIDEKSWEILLTLLKKEEQLDVTVTDITKGGLVVATESGISGFLPNSHTTLPVVDESVLGRKITVSILELNRKDDKAIFSQKRVMKLQEFEEITKQLKKGQKIKAKIANITPFGIFATIFVGEAPEAKTLDSLIHISEIAWEKVEEISSMFTPGDSLDVVVIGFDREARRIDLSIKQLSEDPFTALAKQFPVDTKVSGTIAKIDAAGAYIQLSHSAGSPLRQGSEGQAGQADILGLIRKDKIPPTVSYKEGDSVSATVTEIDARRHKIYLSPVLKEKPIGYR